ncbi:MAG: response regulator [Firmicutes bacterium]|nr:response regulator [Bacillota bacterium]
MKVKLLIAESNFEEQERLRELFMTEDNFELTATAECGTEAIKLVEEHQPDVIICNFALKNTDGVTLCERVKQSGHETRVIVMSSAFSDYTVKRMVEAGVDHHLIRPFEPECLIKNICELANVAGTKPMTRAATVMEDFPQISRRKLEVRLSNVLTTIGITAHIQGFKFIKEAVIACIEDQALSNQITKRLYPMVAKKFQTTPSKVERAIRHAIDAGWNRERFHNLNEIFGVRVVQDHRNDKPTNGEFVSFLAERLIIENA